MELKKIEKNIKITSREAVMLLYYFDYVERTEWTAWEDGKKAWGKSHNSLKEKVNTVLKKFD